MKILINTPDWRKPYKGGVANHYHGLRKYWKHNVKYNIVGSRGKAGSGIFYLPFDVIRFIFKLLLWRPDIVVLNPSLAPNAMRRDSLFLKIASLFKVKTVVFFHGFNLNYAESLDSGYFCSLFSKADSFIVLATKFKEYLRSWGIDRPIYLATTKVDDNMPKAFDPSQRDGKIETLLVLSRIEKPKGVYEAVELFRSIQSLYPNLTLRIVGDGSELPDLKSYVNEIGLANVLFTGALSGEALIKEFITSDLYLLLSYHEGMPTSVLEAMAFGLPVITRPVGGLVDFFENGRMGEMVDSMNPVDFIDPLKRYLENPVEAKRVGQYNYCYARNNFYASVVAKKMENVLEEVLND